MTNDKIKISWFSNAPWAPTGYGCQTRINYPRIMAMGYDLAISAFYGIQGAKMTTGDGVEVYPIFKHRYGQDVIGAHARIQRADAIITLMDAWVVQPENTLGIPWYPWFPVDAEPMPIMVYNAVAKAKKGIVMSKFGKRMAERMGLDVYYVPHSIETQVFKPGNQNESRRKLGLPADKFIVGMVAANKGNPPRKSFFEQITAFAAMHKEHPDSILYLHTDDGTYGQDMVNLKRYCEVMGLTVGYADCRPLDDSIDVAFVEQYQYHLGIPDQYMVDVYNALDVMMLCSMGEGFGVPLIESQACGCPVITGAWTAMEELFFAGWLIPKEEADATWNSFFEAFQWRVRTEAVTDRLMKAYNMAGNPEYRKAARKGAAKYDADKVAEKYWKPVLEDIQANLEAE